MQMTRDDLNTLVLDNIKKIVSSDVLEVIKEQVAAAVAPVRSETAGLMAQILKGQEKPAPVMEKGLAFARFARAQAAGKMLGVPPDQILEQWGNPDLAHAYVESRKALAAGVATAGGFLVPETFSTDIIELRRAMTVVRSAGCREIPMPNGTVKVPKITSGATGSYIGENTNIGKSEPVFGQVQLTARKLACLTPISNDLLRTSSPAADAVVRDDLVRSLAVTEDAAFLRGTGATEPKGLRYHVPAGNIVDAQTASITAVPQDLGYLILKLKNANVPMTRPRLIFSPRSEHYLITMQQTTGPFIFRDEMIARRTVLGIPYSVTTSVPINLTVGANADCSEVYLFDADDAVIGDTQRLALDVSSEAAYYDGSSVVAAFSLDQTVVRAIAEHDFGMRDVNAVAVMLGVRWSA